MPAVSKINKAILHCSIYVSMCERVVIQHQTFLSINECDTTNGMVTEKYSTSTKTLDVPLETIYFDPMFQQALKEAVDVFYNYYVTV